VTGRLSALPYPSRGKPPHIAQAPRLAKLEPVSRPDHVRKTLVADAPISRFVGGWVGAVTSGDIEDVGKMYVMNDGVVALSDRGFWLADRDFSTRDEAFEAARAVVTRRGDADGVDPLPVIGDFVIPRPDGAASRDFQTLHFDFGLPLVPAVAQDVARYTALYIARSAAGVSASTRLVPLVPLLRGRDWPQRAELLARFVAYGRTHGAWDDSRGYSEGSLARVIEAAVAASPLLPSVKADPDFLCGMEFDSLTAELAFFRRHGLDVEEAMLELPCGRDS
jgi:hypothetical protein